MTLVIHSGLCPLQHSVRRLDIISSRANETIPRDKSDTHCTCPLPSNSLQTSAKIIRRPVQLHRRATLFQYLTVWKPYNPNGKILWESRRRKLSVLCYPEPVLQHCAQVFGCARLWSEWSESASKPQDIASQQPRAPLRLPSRFGDRAFIQQGTGWLVGWLKTHEHVPIPLTPRECVCGRERETQPLRICNLNWIPLIRFPTDHGEMKAKGWGCSLLISSLQQI